MVRWAGDLGFRRPGGALFERGASGEEGRVMGSGEVERLEYAILFVVLVDILLCTRRCGYGLDLLVRG